MRVTTLKAPAGRLGGLLEYYRARERPGPARGPVDYYLDPDEPAGRWWGSGLRALGLDGEVTGGELRSVLDGEHPTSGQRLGRSFGDASARAFDATFSAPKSVSVLWAITPDPWVRAEVVAAHDAAVDAALGWFETHGAVTRRGHDGILQVDTRGVAVAVFRQHTSRTMDPQLHSHAVISAKVQDPTGRWLSLDARFLKFQQRTIGWVYDAALRCELTGRLGVEWEPVVDGPVDMTCIPESVRDLFSQRRVQVEAKLHELIRAWSADHDGADSFGPTETYSQRTLRLPTFLRDGLADHMASHPNGRDDLVFTGTRGAPLRHNLFYTRHFKPAVRRAGLPDRLRFHDLRHTCAALLIAQGAHPKAIMERLGHSSIQVTLDRYGHLLPTLDQALTVGLEATYQAALGERDRRTEFEDRGACAAPREPVVHREIPRRRGIFAGSIDDTDTSKV